MRPGANGTPCGSVVQRRALCAALGLTLLELPLHAVAQPAGMFRVAWVSMDAPGSNSPVFAAFRNGLAELGYVEGRNLVIDSWWGEGSRERLEQLRPQILRARPQVIVANGGIALGPLRDASITVPVLFSMSADPVLAGVVASYSRPGGNVTGITLFAADLIGKRMAMLKQLLPNLNSVAVLANPAHRDECRRWSCAVEGTSRRAAETIAPCCTPCLDTLGFLRSFEGLETRKSGI